MNYSTLDEAYHVAKKSRLKAHAPYSQFFVGAALKVKGQEEIIPGCNVENISFGGTICAERNALSASIANHGKQDFEYIVIVCDTDPLTVPCGMCLQVLAEFCPADFPVHLGDLKELKKTYLLSELLPHTFNTLKLN